MQQEAPLQWFVMSGVEAVDRSMAWLAVQQLQNVLKGLQQASEQGGAEAQLVVQQAIAEISLVKPEAPTPVLLAAHKLATVLGTLLIQLQGLQQQQHPASGSIRLPMQLLLWQMLVCSQVKEVERHLKDLQQSSKEAAVARKAAAAAEVAVAPAPSEPLPPDTPHTSSEMELRLWRAATSLSFNSSSALRSGRLPSVVSTTLQALQRSFCGAPVPDAADCAVACKPPCLPSDASATTAAVTVPPVAAENSTTTPASAGAGSGCKTSPFALADTTVASVAQVPEQRQQRQQDQLLDEEFQGTAAQTELQQDSGFGDAYASWYAMWDTPGLREAASMPAVALDAAAEDSASAAAASVVGDTSSVQPGPSQATAGSFLQQQQQSTAAAVLAASGGLLMPLNVIPSQQLVLTKPLGSGAFGTVYAGTWLGADVAVKLLQPEDSSSGGDGSGGSGSGSINDGGSISAGVSVSGGTGSEGEAVRAQLEKEVLLQAKCSHPNVVKFYAMCYDPPAIVMELCSGTSLGKALQTARARHDLQHWQQQQQQQPSASASNGSGNKSSSGISTSTRTNAGSSTGGGSSRSSGARSGPLLAWPTRLQLLRQAAAALMCMHDRPTPLLHNDVRADNMLLDRTPKGWQLKVADFGLAEQAGPDRNSALVAATTNPLWVAPEVLHSSTSRPDKLYAVSKASDTYSLGAVLWEALTGQAPLTNDDTLGNPDLRAWQVEYAASTGNPVQLGFPPPHVLLPGPDGACCPDDITQQLESLLASCCSLDPTARPDVDRVEQQLRLLAGRCAGPAPHPAGAGATEGWLPAAVQQRRQLAVA